MNMNQIINMAFRMLMRRGMNAGIRHGMNAFQQRNNRQQDTGHSNENFAATDDQTDQSNRNS